MERTPITQLLENTCFTRAPRDRKKKESQHQHAQCGSPVDRKKNGWNPENFIMISRSAIGMIVAMSRIQATARRCPVKRNGRPTSPEKMSRTPLV